jgi:methionyl-tRNA formyltransferase
MKILLIGGVEFTRHCLQEIVKQGGNDVEVMTVKREHAKFNSDYVDLGETAAALGIPVHYTEKVRSPESVELIRAIAPDAIFVFGFSQLISAEILAIPPLGCIGTHPALLPRNRGRHPLIWALVEGLPQSGLTFFYLDEGTDSGDILWQKAFPISLENDASTLYEKIRKLASEGIADFLPKLMNNTAPRIVQDATKATYWLKRTAKDGEIHWDQPSMTIYNLIRALTHPYPGSHTFLAGEKIIVWKASPPAAESANGQSGHGVELPGTVVKGSASQLRVRTGDGYLTILDYSRANGQRVASGSKLGPEA